MTTRPTKKLWEISIVFADWDRIESKDQSKSWIRLIQTGNVWIGFFKDREEKWRYISAETFKRLNCTEIVENDCLVSRLPEPVGRACIIPKLNNKLITAVDCTIIRFDEKQIYPKYFVFYSQSNLYQNDIEKECSWTTRKRISRKKLWEIEIPLPPLDIQKAIVTKLDEAFAEIDEAISLTEESIAKTEEFKKSLLDKVFEDREWGNVKLNDIFDVRDWTHDSPKFFDKWFPLVTSKNLLKTWLDLQKVNFIKQEDYDNINKRSKVDKWDLLFAMIWTIWNPTIVDIETDFAIKNVALFKPKNNTWTMEYLRYFLLSETTINKMTNESKWATQKFVWLNYLRNFEIPLPPLEKQAEIVKYLDQVFAETSALKSDYETKLTHLKEFKASILQSAFEGKLIAE